MTIDHSVPILVVDDFKTMVRIMRNFLTDLGFTDVDDASNGEDALEKMRSKSYALVISDWNMQPMTVFALLRRVRADPRTTSTRFIMVTAESKTDNVLSARQAGVEHYLVKPFNAQMLRSKLEQVLTN